MRPFVAWPATQSAWVSACGGIVCPAMLCQPYDAAALEASVATGNSAKPPSAPWRVPQRPPIKDQAPH